MYSSRAQYYTNLVKVYTNSMLIIFDLPPKSIAPLHLAVNHQPCAQNEGRTIQNIGPTTSEKCQRI
jgi:hypothetical protein